MLRDNSELFYNEEVDVHTLPKHEDVNLMPLDVKYKKMMVIHTFLNTIIITIIISIPAITAFYGEWGMLYFYLPVIIIQCIQFLLINRKFQTYKYAIRDKDVIYRSGLIHNQCTIMPYNKIQHVSIHESWLARRFDLAKVVIFTTGDSMSIPGLHKNLAHDIKFHILDIISDNISSSTQVQDLNDTETSDDSTKSEESDD